MRILVQWSSYDPNGGFKKETVDYGYIVEKRQALISNIIDQDLDYVLGQGFH